MFVGMLMLTGCGGDTSAPGDEPSDGPNDNMGGSSNSGGVPASAAGMPSSTGGASNAGAAATGPMITTLPDGTECQVVPNESVSDFAMFTGAASNGMWGATNGLTGSSFLYNNATTATVDASTLTGAVASGVMELGGEVTQFGGFGLAFGPICNDATRFTGLRFTIGGTTLVVGGTMGESGVVQVQMQTRNNAPDGSRGVCEGDFGSGCGFNFSEFALPATPEAVEVPFEMMTGGDPEDTVDPQQLLGIQWQFGCSSDGSQTCEIDVTLDNVEFY